MRFKDIKAIFRNSDTWVCLYETDGEKSYVICCTAVDAVDACHDESVVFSFKSLHKDLIAVEIDNS